MAIYRIIKINLKRFFTNKRTYLLALLIPIILSVFGIVSSNVKMPQRKIGIIASPAVYNNFLKTAPENIIIHAAKASSKNTDIITGKYDCIIEEKNGELTIPEELFNEKEPKTHAENIYSKVLALLLSAYMIIATIYQFGYIKDRKKGVITRYITSGRKFYGYSIGYFVSTAILIGTQLILAYIITYFALPKNNISFVSLAAAFLFTFVFCTLFGNIVVLLFKKEMQAGLISSSFAAICTILGGAFIPLSSLPAPLQYLSVINPIRIISSILE